MRSVTISAIQFDIKLGELKNNVEKAFTLIERAAERGSNLIVLPEMWPLGFDYEALKSMPPSYVDDILGLLKDVAIKYRTIIVTGSICEYDNGRFYNTSHLIDEKGNTLGKYRKIHLFKEIGEKDFFAPGNAIKVFDSSIGKIGLAICYDIRFPELFRSMALSGVEIICVPSQFPEPRLEHWEVLLAARAIENQLFVVGVNRSGRSGKFEYFGHSTIFGPYGEVCGQAGDGDEVLTETVDIEKMYEIRQVLPSISERRADVYAGGTDIEMPSTPYPPIPYPEAIREKEAPFKFKDTIQPMKPRN